MKILKQMNVKHLLDNLNLYKLNLVKNYLLKWEVIHKLKHYIIN